jgi:oligopeptide/dipeptide ABC transporter ATP-binding protein
VSALLDVRGLAKSFPAGTGAWSAGALVRAVDGVDLTVGRGEIVGLVGESGSGKTTLGRAILRLCEPTAGAVRFDGLDVLALRAREMRRLRRRMQIVFQDPGAALNPRMKVRSLVGEPLSIHGLARGRALTERVAQLLEEVGLDPSAMERYPREFSGGQKQRIGIARAIGLRPDFVVCDEPVASLDVSVQAQIVNLLVDLQRRLGMAYLFIAHDLTLVSHLCDRIAVMYLGRIVEEAPAGELRVRAYHPYTRALFAAVPPPDPERARQVRAPLPGEIPSPVDVPPGCRFHPRCPHVQPRCRVEDPPLREVAPGRRAACHFAEDVGGLQPEPPARTFFTSADTRPGDRSDDTAPLPRGPGESPGSPRC